MQIQLLFSKNLFWDIELSDLDMEKYAAYIVGRVLDYGRWEDWRLIRDFYGLGRIKEVALKLRSMMPKSLSFIATVTHTQENQYRCYELLQSDNIHWSFFCNS